MPPQYKTIKFDYKDNTQYINQPQTLTNDWLLRFSYTDQ